MTNKEFRRLSRADLIDIICELQAQLAEAQEKTREVEAQLEARELRIREAGSIAEASLQLNDIFGVAQASADQYLKEIQRLKETAQSEAEELLAKAREEAARIIASARDESEYIRKKPEDAVWTDWI